MAYNYNRKKNYYRVNMLDAVKPPYGRTHHLCTHPTEEGKMVDICFGVFILVGLLVCLFCG